MAVRISFTWDGAPLDDFPFRSHMLQPGEPVPAVGDLLTASDKIRPDTIYNPFAKAPFVVTRREFQYGVDDYLDVVIYVASRR